jgi:vancomycin permeability regulator SanA
MPLVDDPKRTPTILVVMGAAVWPGGVPSKAMLRRIDSALANNPDGDAVFIVSGGVGANPPSEAQAMRQLLLTAGIPSTQIRLDEESKNTLSSIRNCAKLIRLIPHSRVLVCSDRYHIPRCRWLFRLLGIKTEAATVASGRAGNGYIFWFSYYMREVLACPWDTLLLVLGYQG